MYNEPEIQQLLIAKQQLGRARASKSVEKQRKNNFVADQIQIGKSSSKYYYHHQFKYWLIHFGYALYTRELYNTQLSMFNVMFDF